MAGEKSEKPKGSMLFWLTLIVIAFLCLVLIGNIVANKNPEGMARLNLQDAVKARLKDPASATFDQIETFEYEHGQYALCGRVNAKNSFGAFTGYTRFVATSGLTLLENEDGAKGGVFEGLVAKACHN